jgi:hypothetical protein
MEFKRLDWKLYSEEGISVAIMADWANLLRKGVLWLRGLATPQHVTPAPEDSVDSFMPRRQVDRLINKTFSDYFCGTVA